MNEKLNDLLDSVQQVSDAAVNAAYGAGKKAGELLSVAKLNIRIVETRADVNTALKEVGEMLYATHTGHPTDSEVLQAKLEEIDELKAKIDGMEEELKKDKGPVCPTCGAPVGETDAFCGTCGGKL